MKKPIYFDYAATTPVDTRVVAAMRPFFVSSYGNPSSLHCFGRTARVAVEKARMVISEALGAEPEEIIFTSGGTESNNFAIKGIAFANRVRGRHIVVSTIEHECVYQSCRWLEREGFSITYLSVDGNGLVDPDALMSALRPDTVLVSIMHANNEIGTIESIEELAWICKSRGISFHTDACQSFGKIPLSVRDVPVDLITINAHKIYGPKGVGALYIRKNTPIMPWQHGGGQESGMRSSTENVPGIVGFGKATELSVQEMVEEGKRLTALRDRIISSVIHDIPGAYLNGHPTDRLPNNINVAVHGLEGEAIRLLLELDRHGIAVSTGSACSSNQENQTSHVLAAIGRDSMEARGGIRITIGRFTTNEEVTYLLKTLPEVTGSLKSISSVRLS